VRTLKLFIILFLFLTCGALAQPEVTPTLFTQRVAEWTEQDNLAAVAQAVRFYGDVGRQAFDKMLEVHKMGPSPLTEKWLNTVARAFRLEGNDGPNRALIDADMLWANTRWRGTMFEDDQIVDTRGTIAEKVPEKTLDATDDFEEALAATHLAVRVGNDTALPSMQTALRKYIEKHPDHPKKGEVLALEVSAKEATGLWDEALKLGEESLGQVEGADAIVIKLAMLSAARKLEQPRKVDELLQSLERDLEGTDDPLPRFIVESVAFERDCQKREVTLDELTRRHVPAWRNLRTDKLGMIPGGLGRQIVEAAGIWVHQSLQRMQIESDEFPNRAQLYYVVWEDLRKLRRLSKSQLALRFQPSEAMTFMKLWNPEFMLATQALQLEVVDSWRRNGQTEHAKVLLSEIEGSIQESWENIREAGLGYQMAHYGNPIKLEGGQFEFVWTMGEAPRMVALHRLARARLNNDDRALEEAVEFQKDARTQGGFLGLEDARFLQVERTVSGPNPAGAASLNQELAQLSERSGYRPGRIVTLVNSAEIAQKTRQPKEALQKAQEAVDLIEEYLTEAGASQVARKRFRRAYELLAELQLEAGQNQDAFGTLARLGQAESVMTLNPRVVASKKPELKKMLKELDNTRARTRALNESKQNQASAGRSIDATDGLIAENRSQFYKTLGEIRRQYPGYGQMLAVRPVNFARMQKFVPKDTAVVQIFPASDALFLFVLTTDSLKIKKVAVPGATVESLAKKARVGLLASKHRGMRSRARRALAPVESTAEESLDAFVELHKLLVDPIAQELEPYEVVAFIPSGSLMNVPLQALAKESGGSLEFLIERKQVVTLSKSTDLERLARKPAVGRGGALVVGNPDGTLPGATKEAQSIAKMLPGATVLLGDEATLNKVKNESGKSYVHLATHGILNKDDPNLTYLVLGQGEKLDIGEIAGLDLGEVRMVTLSACETALGEDPAAQGELTTLADAFGFAGCPTVTASLWQVSDDSTKLLMEKFYEELEGGAAPAAALQTAQKTLIEKEETRHPYHWAPFLLIGDWR
jgi:CHAT domain-containing protein/AraC-like DNA-binding protein